MLFEVVGRIDQVIDVGLKGGVSKASLAITNTGKIQPQHAYTLVAEGATDMVIGLDVLGTGKAMGQGRKGANVMVFRSVDIG